MRTARTLKPIIAEALLSGGVAIAGLGLAAGTAQAQPGFFSQGTEWCPGQHWEWLVSPPADWDMSVCHNVKVIGHHDGTWTVVEDTVPPAPPAPSLPLWVP
jgi:hypothetical protein